MTSFTCRNLTPDIIRGWLDERLDSVERDAVGTHLRGCPACSQAVTRTVSNGLWGFLTGEGRDQVPAFLDEVSDILQSVTTPPTLSLVQPLTHALQQLLAATRDMVWPPFHGLAHTSATHTLGGGGGAVLQEMNEEGHAVGTPLLVSEDNVLQGPRLTKEGQFQLRLTGTEPHLIGKTLICAIQLMDGKTLSLQTAIVPSATTTGWEAVFDEGLLTDPAMLSNKDYRIPFDHLKLVVEPRATTL